MRTIFFCMILASAFISCNNNPKDAEPTLLLDCYVRVLESESMVMAEGTLKKMPQPSTPNATPQPIQVPGDLRFQSAKMDVMPNQGLTYRTEFKGVYRPDLVFSWDDEKLKVRHAFRVDMNDFKNYSFGSKTITLGKPDTCTWESAPLQQGETLVFMWENIKTRQAVPIELYGAAASPMITFPAKLLESKLAEGPWSLYIVRKKLQKGDAGGVPAQAVMEFFSQTDTFNIVR